MKRPLPWFAFALCLGILVASRIKFPLTLTYAFLLVFLILSFFSLKKGRLFDLFLFFSIFTLGVVFFENAQSLPKCHISHYVFYHRNEPYIIKGIVDSQPLLRNNKASFIFKTQSIQSGNLNHACCGNILVYLNGEGELNYGAELILRGNLYRPPNRKNRQRQNYRDYLYNQGIWFILQVKSTADIVKLNKNSGLAIKRFALRLKCKIENIISRYVSRFCANILEAMILGERRNIPPFVNDLMVKTGTVHILVVSGFNVGIVSFIIILFLKLIRLPRKIRFSIAIMCLVIYCLMTGASTPVVRATVMAIVLLLGLILQRETDMYNSLSVAALCILVFDPRQLFDIGFQLSFVSVLSIVYLFPQIKSLLAIESLKTKYLKFMLEGCLVSFSAWIGTMGFIAYYFQIFSPITALANIIIVPLATLITLCGFSLILMGLIFPALAPFFASTSELAVMLLVKINVFFLKLPGAYLHLGG